jgi:hypothetical protein
VLFIEKAGHGTKFFQDPSDLDNLVSAAPEMLEGLMKKSNTLFSPGNPELEDLVAEVLKLALYDIHVLVGK